jgi:redox-sensitive bicupin YhaK (pirin superfamily)
MIVQQSKGLETSDGDGVRMRRMVGTPEIGVIDPLLMLDAFGSDEPLDYIGGFPDHPHRGFETVTYLLAGRMRHKDNAGHEGVIEPGGVQWMTAGRGIVHSEMPEQEDGRLAGFQLWINLPAKHKMTAPAYQEFPAAKIPLERIEAGGQIKVITGQTDQGTIGAVSNIITNPIFFDVTLDAGAEFNQRVPAEHNGFIYVIDGEARLGDGGTVVPERTLGVLGDGDHIRITAGDAGARFLLISAERINEPVAWRGPFVMNTENEIRQAFDDYRKGRF